ncbi:MAG: hypothetical protein A3C85_04770 [Candidatus Doudnabacteria bacterium RIFCSPHIGHO2_02_FULL_48_21]|uniref:DNA 3'-5' helicase n=1 Tax=Candidatus Doudnabacteria bacterium RIFCSPLOWO2_02_FULL_48_13 TaxID=1817845 RepID=A0A1F5QCG4_9BACT|nr:MAG: hypothetical protein A3K05_02285 [Candidatus Doudnabacteria bacterium RIFCSPHIGHO2_01_48_18]OGE90956.1 MAG: hypothetical protein A3F44_03560 [Candidatus Doudnabacteria bacterium RIFCSPHIGHO2_12_FULL_47_25]OGE92817.1 MAG: hypothetical protein A3C85_04770 [Candidatus Doudnabacteria bacterium RIFCSPHIGHO2_02_FULL_48_21]OGE98136.1 MAG: hypothetical protein A3A83_00695 [Candidatus Doudnabacteria bacterium RIFCSPLOWO2_01_FULL_48_57]OGE99891.1 MAG: hypothetical protein A3J05_03520 [Candidatus 
MNELLKNLNSRQKEAVTAPLGPVLVLAGAGSGKTRALTMRIAYLIKEKLFKPEEILALTFTNKAAGEMKERIAKLLPTSYKQQAGITMGTFHSVGLRILRMEIEKLGGGYDRNFTIYDSDDSMRLVKQIVLELGLSESFRPQVFSYYISAGKNKLIQPGEMSLDNEYLEQSLSRVWKEYEKNLRENNALDFDDLLILTYQLLSEVPAVLQKYQSRFQYVLVDEYQDTNHVQYMLLKKLTAKHGNLFVVGDDAQSIYGFRGANMQNILDFKKDYPKAKVVMLEQNYRSTKPILDVANEVIKLSPFQYEKALWTDNLQGEKVNLYEASDELDESRFVLRQLVGEQQVLEEEEEEYRDPVEFPGETPILDSFMAKLKRRRFGMRPRFVARELPDDLKDCVILYRTHAQSRPLEEMLVGSGIPYQIVGGIKFYERREIKDALAYLRLMQNPRDLVSLERVINLPARGIGKSAFRGIAKELENYGHDFQRVSLNIGKFGLQNKAENGAREFFDLLHRARELPQSNSVLDVMQLILKGSGYKDLFLKEGREGEERWENVEELFNVAGKFGKLPWPAGLEAMLEEVALMSDLDRVEEQTNKLTLMTLHSAKGLEFGKVFFVGLEEGILPHTRSLLSPQEIAEEVRLAYVGITRARKILYLSYARARQSYGEIKKSVPSRILKAIPGKMINKLS